MSDVSIFVRDTVSFVQKNNYAVESTSVRLEGKRDLFCDKRSFEDAIAADKSFFIKRCRRYRVADDDWTSNHDTGFNNVL